MVARKKYREMAHTNAPVRDSTLEHTVNQVCLQRLSGFESACPKKITFVEYVKLRRIIIFLIQLRIFLAKRCQ